MKKIILFSSLFVLPAGSLAFLLKDKIMDNIFKKRSKDETRFNSIDYGMSWGSRTDELVNLLLCRLSLS
jgi:hypothetical protein